MNIFKYLLVIFVISTIISGMTNHEFERVEGFDYMIYEPYLDISNVSKQNNKGTDEHYDTIDMITDYKSRLLSLENDDKSDTKYRHISNLKDEVKDTLDLPPIFLKIDQFEGRKDGMVFKTGEFGLGYYRDRIDKIMTIQEIRNENLEKDRNNRIRDVSLNYTPYEVILPTDKFSPYKKRVIGDKPYPDDILTPEDRVIPEYDVIRGEPCVGEWSDWNSNFCGSQKDRCALKRRVYTVQKVEGEGGLPCPHKDGDIQFDYCYGGDNIERCGFFDNYCDCNLDNKDVQDFEKCSLLENDNQCQCPQGYDIDNDGKCKIKDCVCPNGIQTSYEWNLDKGIRNECIKNEKVSCDICDEGLISSIDGLDFICRDVVSGNNDCSQYTPSFTDDEITRQNKFNLCLQEQGTNDDGVTLNICYPKYQDNKICNDKEYYELPDNVYEGDEEYSSFKKVYHDHCNCKNGKGKRWTSNQLITLAGVPPTPSDSSSNNYLNEIESYSVPVQSAYNNYFSDVPELYTESASDDKVLYLRLTSQINLNLNHVNNVGEDTLSNNTSIHKDALCPGVDADFSDNNYSTNYFTNKIVGIKLNETELSRTGYDECVDCSEGYRLVMDVNPDTEPGSYNFGKIAENIDYDGVDNYEKLTFDTVVNEQIPGSTERDNYSKECHPIMCVDFRNDLDSLNIQQKDFDRLLENSSGDITPQNDDMDVCFKDVIIPTYPMGQVTVNLDGVDTEIFTYSNYFEPNNPDNQTILSGKFTDCFDTFECKPGFTFVPNSEHNEFKDDNDVIIREGDTTLRLLSCPELGDIDYSGTNETLYNNMYPDMKIKMKENIEINNDLTEDEIYDLKKLKFNGTCVPVTCPITDNLRDSFDLSFSEDECNADDFNCGLGDQLECKVEREICNRQINALTLSTRKEIALAKDMGFEMDDESLMRSTICETPILKCNSPPFMKTSENVNEIEMFNYGCYMEPEADDDN